MTETKRIIQIINNIAGNYPGNLKEYFRIVWRAPNIMLPYHNIRHMLHVMWDVYDATLAYPEIDERTRRNLLIAALFHDYNHTGSGKDDAVNIRNAVQGLRTHILPVDEPYFDEITSYIKATQFPHQAGDLDLPALIMRDADVASTLSDVWIAMVSFGLNKELGLSPEEMLKAQKPFLGSIKFGTDWAEQKYR